MCGCSGWSKVHTNSAGCTADTASRPIADVAIMCVSVFPEASVWRHTPPPHAPPLCVCRPIYDTVLKL